MSRAAVGTQRTGWRLVLLACLSATLAGCAGGGVTLRVAGVSMGERSDAGATIVFALEARNAGAQEVELRQARYSLDIGGKRVFEGTRSAEATVAAGGVATVKLPVAVAWKSLGVADAAALASARLTRHFRAEVQCVPPDILGKALFTTGLRKPVERVEDAGALTFAQPESAMESGG